VEKGARLVCGGAPTGTGLFFEPTLLDHCTEEMKVVRDETFGPVLAVVRVDGAADALRRVNRARYGLGASIWTADPKRGERVAREIEAGSVFVNALVKSDPRLPFGGVKRSGYGRELSQYGLREFVNIKTVWVA
jgi:succinate-semialdehyde dehydrogenase/glutarate-semialdehyde dehydrogenase